MALIYKKENGFPVDLTIITEEHEDPKESWKGFKSKIYNGEGKLIKEFYHSHHRNRVDWANGYFTALEQK